MKVLKVKVIFKVPVFLQVDIRCSRKIFKPIAIRISPPSISTLFPSLSPADFPIRIAVIEAMKVTAAIRIPAFQIITSSSAKLIPIAKASILVAMEREKSTIWRKLPIIQSWRGRWRIKRTRIPDKPVSMKWPLERRNTSS